MVCLTVRVTRLGWEVGFALETGVRTSQKNAQKTRRLPQVGCTSKIPRSGAVLGNFNLARVTGLDKIDILQFFQALHHKVLAHKPRHP